MKTLYRDNKRHCPSCINPIYAGDCDIVATVDAEVTPDIVPRGVPKQPSPSRNTVIIAKNTKLKKAPPHGSLQQARARMEPEPLIGELYTLTMACRICPTCSYQLPPNFDSAKSLTVAVVGDTTSGKSLYISALIKQIQSGKLIPAGQQLSFTCITEDIEAYYINNYFDPLFKYRRVLRPNQRLTETTHKPLIYELIMRPTRDRPAKRINLVLYDTAGEDYVLRERIVEFGRYVLNADAIIFLADPIAMSEIRDRLSRYINYGAAPARSTTESLDKIISQVRRFRGETSLRSIPIAITLSKADLLKYLSPISDPYSFMQPHEYRGGVDLQDLKKVNAEVKDLIGRFGDATLLKSAATLKRSHFFATSATGYPPDSKGIFPDVQPSRCLDPLLWILYELNIFH